MEEQEDHEENAINSPEIVEINEEEEEGDNNYKIIRMNNCRGGIKDVYVAVGRNDFHAVKWAIDHLVSPGITQLFLVHVFPPVEYISTTVSVNPGMHCEHAVTFLQENIRDGLTFTVEETIQTAISAFMLLCPEEVKLEDIYVSSCRELGGRTVSLSMNEIKQYCPLSMRSRIILPIKNST